MAASLTDIELLLSPECPYGDAASELMRAALCDLQMAVAVRTTIVDSDSEARRRSFTGSPTFLIDGGDPFARADAPTGHACRLYSTKNGLRGLPEIDELRRALKTAAHPRGST